MSYIFYSEIIHFLNLWNTPSIILGMIFYLCVGFLFRFFVRSKKIFYRAWGGMFTLWIICEIIYPIVFTLDKLEFIEIAATCFQWAWILLWILVGSFAFHLICLLFHKKPLN
jgi:hypothetical protein